MTSTCNDAPILPLEILTAIGLYSWSAYKVLFFVDKLTNSELSRHRPSHLFTCIRTLGGGRPADYYRYVVIDGSSVRICINGRVQRRYELQGPLDDVVRVANLTRLRRRGQYIYEEKVVHQFKNKHTVYRERRRPNPKKANKTNKSTSTYMESQTLQLQAVPSGACVKYVNVDDDDTADWLVHAPWFFLYNLEASNG